MTKVTPLGLHHVTAIASDPQLNVDFYLQTLGLKLVKQTVNFDAPDVYHLYYGDEAGNPGTILTFFPWPGTPQGRRGAGQATTTSFSIPAASLGWWKQHLESKGIEVEDAATRLDEDALSFHDPDGLLVELVAHEGTAEHPPWERGPVPPEHQIRSLYAITMTQNDYEATAGMLTEQMGFRLVGEEGDRFRFDTHDGGAGARLDVLVDPTARRGLVAAGTVHHVAWRAPDGEHQADWRGQLVGGGLDVTPIIDRQYFESIYFREPGGVLLEIATDPPGFTIDEPLLELGRKLRLPPWLEPSREDIEHGLPDLKLPSWFTGEDEPEPGTG
jgi:glyoxalase family protein